MGFWLWTVWVLGVALPGCSADKGTTMGTSDGGGEPEDPGPWDTGVVDTGEIPLSGDGGAGDSWPADEWATCSELVATVYDHFDADFYEEDEAEEAPPGTECRCSVSFDDISEGERFQVKLRGAVPGGDEARVPATVYVTAPFGGIGGWGNVSWAESYEDWQDQQEPYLGETVSANGTWQVFLSELNRSGDYVSSCDEYGQVEVKLSNLDTSAGPPPPPTADPSGATEDALLCTKDSVGSTVFQLVDMPSWAHPVPLAIGGDKRYAGAELTQVSVSDWRGADQLVLRSQDSVVTLTPEGPSATLPAGTFPLATTTWWPSRSTAGSWQNPQLQLSYGCAASQPEPVRMEQGYALSLAELGVALEAATGGLGLPEIFTAGEAAGWPVYTLRVVPMLAMPGTGVSHALRLEIPGVRASAALPLVQVGPESWLLEVDRGDYSLRGMVQRTAGKLSLTLDSGTIDTDAGPFTLLPTTLTLDPVPTGQQDAQ